MSELRTAVSAEQASAAKRFDQGEGGLIPAVVQNNGDQPVGDVRLSAVPWDTLESGISAIDETFDRRVAQIDDEVTGSYTLGLLRDPNKAAKKLGEEFMEFVASVEELDEAATTEELADFVFAALTFARGRGKNIKLRDAMNVLVFRNQRKRAGSDERFNLQAEGGRDE